MAASRRPTTSRTRRRVAARRELPPTGARTLALLIFGPVVIYLMVMFGLALFVVHPPTLGWIGLAVVSAVTLLAGSAALLAIPRLRSSGPRLHPRSGLVYRLLIVTDAEVEPDELSTAVRLRVLGRRAEVRIVTPIIAMPLHYFAADEDDEGRQAAVRLQESLRALVEADVHAEGVVGTDDPLQAVADVLAGFPADEILLVGSLPSRRNWLDRDFERQARDRFGVPVSTVFGTDRQPRLAGVQA
jgi:hypothetical protein